MPAINVSREDKKEFDELQPEDKTQKEFFTELLDAYRRDNGEVVDVDALVEGIEKKVSTNVEVHAYRGTKDALERHE